MNIEKKQHSIFEIGSSGLVLQFFVSLTIPIFSKFLKSPNPITALNIILSFFILYFLLINFYLMAGVIIILCLFFDLLDGALARHLKKTSELGKILDSIADILMWLLIILGLYFINQNMLVVVILVIYSADLYIRNIT